MAWVDVDLSTAVFMTYDGDTYGQYTGGTIDELAGLPPSFYFPGVTFDDTKTYDIEVTWTTAGPNDFRIGRYQDHSEAEWAFGFYQNAVHLETVNEAVHTWTVGPGIADWDAAVTAGSDAYVWDTSLPGAISAIRYAEVQPGVQKVWASGIPVLNTPGGTPTSGGVGVIGPGDPTDFHYIDFESGACATCVELDPLGPVVGTPTITLHARIQVMTPGGLPFGGTGEFFLALDSDQSNQEIAGFSDGAAGGFAFVMSLYDQEIHEYVVPLSLGAWSNDSPSNPGGPTTMGDVLDALQAGAFLDINAFGWDEGEAEPIFRVHEAWIEVEDGASPSGAVVLETRRRFAGS